MHGSYTGDNDDNSLFSAMGVEIYENTFNNGAFGMDLFDQRGGMALCYNNIFTGTYTGVWIQARAEDNANLINPITSANGEYKYVNSSYYFGNRYLGTNIVPAIILSQVDHGSPVGLVPQANRDFYNENPLFDGTNGVGVGTFAKRPSTCVLPANARTGVGYWATDQSILYVATANNTWTVFFTPYTYPHPLQTLLSDATDK